MVIGHHAMGGETSGALAACWTFVYHSVARVFLRVDKVDANGYLLEQSQHRDGERVDAVTSQRQCGDVHVRN